jgi:hypothetical protein
MAFAAMSACVQPKCSDYHDPTCWSPPAPTTDAAALDASDAGEPDAPADGLDGGSSSADGAEDAASDASSDGGASAGDATADAADS